MTQAGAHPSSRRLEAVPRYYANHTFMTTWAADRGGVVYLHDTRQANVAVKL